MGAWCIGYASSPSGTGGGGGLGSWVPIQYPTPPWSHPRPKNGPDLKEILTFSRLYPKYGKIPPNCPASSVKCVLNIREHHKIIGGSRTNMDFSLVLH